MTLGSSRIIVAALRDEAKYVRQPVQVTGMGAQPICDAIDRLKPAAVTLIGFAGGLNPALHTGDVLRIGRVLHDSGEPIELEGDATLLTVDELAGSLDAKRQLHARTHADAVDMETYHVARHCHGRGIHLDVVRAISDPADAALPIASVNWVKPDGSHNVGAAVRYLLTHPHHLPMLMRLERDSKAAARALGITLST